MRCAAVRVRRRFGSSHLGQLCTSGDSIAAVGVAAAAGRSFFFVDVWDLERACRPGRPVRSELRHTVQVARNEIQPAELERSCTRKAD